MAKLTIPFVAALNAKHQANVTKSVKAEVAYQQANNDHAAAEDRGDHKQALKYAKLMERLYQKLVDVQFDLPLGENRNVMAKLKAHRGY